MFKGPVEKTGRRGILAFVLAVTMALALVAPAGCAAPAPTETSGSSSVAPPPDAASSLNIKISYQADSSGFVIARQDFAVAPDLAEQYGYTDSFGGGLVSALDAIVAAHIAVFGADKELVNSKLQTGSGDMGEFISSFMGDGTGNMTFLVNGVSAMNSAPAQKLAEGDVVELNAVRDTVNFTDAVSWFEVPTVPAASGSVSASGAAADAPGAADAPAAAPSAAADAPADAPSDAAVAPSDAASSSAAAPAPSGSAPDAPTAPIRIEAGTIGAGRPIELSVWRNPGMGWGTPETLAGAGIVRVSRNPVGPGATFSAPLALTDAEGKATLTFELPGTYLLSAIDSNADSQIPLMSPWLELTVKPAATAGTAPTAAEAKTVADKLASTLSTALAEANDYQSEWLVIGLARGGYLTHEQGLAYLDALYETVSPLLSASDNRLDATRATENARVILAASVLGVDATRFGDYDLTAPLADFSYVTQQGVNSAAWALLALNSGGYGQPAVRDALVAWLAEQRLESGGWALSGSETDADTTAMVLTALAPYYATGNANLDAVIVAGAKALAAQQSDGGFGTHVGGDFTMTAESCAWAVVALASLGIPLDDSQFVQQEVNPYDALLSYYLEEDGDSGAFSHLAGGAANDIASGQAMLALQSELAYLSGAASPFVSGKGQLLPYATEAAVAGAAATAQGAAQADAGAAATTPAAAKTEPASTPGSAPASDPAPAPAAQPAATLSVDAETLGRGYFLAPRSVSFTAGESVFDLLQRECRSAGIPMEFNSNPLYSSAYIEGINNLYEFDGGPTSGWMYNVNGWYPNYGCSSYVLQDGDVVQWRYTCDLGADIGGSGGALGGV
ncbi:MAG: DUF4430 domain-containing protein [Coriobacteriales bacterium]|nr:DUF4430 domain-containing protein [Coriobacteriales bacterium]